MIEFIKLHIFEISYLLMLFAVVCAYIALHLQIKARKELFKEYKELADEHDNVLLKYWEQTVEIFSLCVNVEKFVEEHNSWHDRKIAFYYDKDGWHCCYDDEMPQGDTFIDQEEITPQNENKDENQQSI